MKKSYFFPQYERSIVAESQEEAEKILDKQIKEENKNTKRMDDSKVENKGIPGRVSNK